MDSRHEAQDAVKNALSLSSVLAAACAQPAQDVTPRAELTTSARTTPAAGTCDSARGPLELELVSLSDADALAYTCRLSRPPCKNASHPSVSADGAIVAFDSDAPGVLGDATPPPGTSQIYVRDTVRAQTVLVSGRMVNGQAVFADTGAGFPDLSGDGRWVVFATKASNLVENDANDFADVFAANLDARSLVRVSENSDGSGFDSESADATVSDDGRWIAFVSAASNIAPLFASGGTVPIAGPVGGRMRLFVAERSTRRVEWLDRGAVDESRAPEASQPAISADASVVAFTLGVRSPAADGEAKFDVYASLRETGEVVLVSAALGSTLPGNDVSRKPQISGNGRFVVFEGLATDLIAPGADSNNQSDVFVRDLQLASTARVSVSSSGGQANGTSGYGALSYDGRYVAFSSSARNLVANDTTRGFLDCFVHDRDVSGDGVFDEPGDICTRRMSTTPEGVQANARSGGNCDLSADGRFLVFMSESNLLHPGDDNGVDDELRCSPTCLFGRDVFRARVY